MSSFHAAFLSSFRFADSVLFTPPRRGAFFDLFAVEVRLDFLDLCFSFFDIEYFSIFLGSGAASGSPWFSIGFVTGPCRSTESQQDLDEHQIGPSSDSQ